MENQTECHAISGSKSTKPKDPLYFSKYYQNKVKGVKHYCEICNTTIVREKRVEHSRSKKHIKNKTNIDTFIAFIVLIHFNVMKHRANA